VLVVPYSERPELVERLEEIEDVWPEFLYHTDARFNALWRRVWREFPDFQLVLYDDATDSPAGRGQTIPFRWDGTWEDLPNGVDGVVRRVFEAGGEPTTLSALLAIVDPRYQGRGLSTLIIEGMRRLAGEHGLDALLAPVRPTLKARHSQTPMEDYLGWRRADGQLFDPWLRVHEQIGGEILGVCPGSLVVEGTVAEWEQWTGMAFPESGSYVVEGALVPVEIDRARDVGRYVEPNVWMRHSVSAGGGTAIALEG
jgi:GNAT superfamily N-acetyltransferase